MLLFFKEMIKRGVRKFYKDKVFFLHPESDKCWMLEVFQARHVKITDHLKKENTKSLFYG